MGSITQIADNLFQFPVRMPNNPLKWLNCYVIRGNDNKRNLLIDTGFNMPICQKDLDEGIEMLGLNMEKTDVFITHFHPDHCGNAQYLSKKGSRILISRIDGELLKTDNNVLWNVSKRYYHAGLDVPVYEKMFADNPVYDTRDKEEISLIYVEENDVLRYGEYNLRCILTPGHSPGHMCLYEENKELLFCGDHVLFDVTPNISCWEDGQDLLGKYLQSLERISELKVKTALPGHRALPQITLKKRCEEIRIHHENRLNEMLKVIKIHPGSTAYEIAGMMTWDIRALNWNDFPVVQKFFAVNETISHLDHLTAEEKISEDRTDNDYKYYIK